MFSQEDLLKKISSSLDFAFPSSPNHCRPDASPTEASVEGDEYEDFCSYQTDSTHSVQNLMKNEEILKIFQFYPHFDQKYHHNSHSGFHFEDMLAVKTHTTEIFPSRSNSFEDESTEDITALLMSQLQAGITEKKMTEMNHQLQLEVNKLKQQKQKTLEETSYLQRKMEIMKLALEAETQELFRQERALEIDRLEALYNPDPIIERPELNTGDDDFTRKMKEEGYVYFGKNNEMKTVRADALPAELSLAAFLQNSHPNNSAPILFSNSSPAFSEMRFLKLPAASTEEESLDLPLIVDSAEVSSEKVVSLPNNSTLPLHLQTFDGSLTSTTSYIKFDVAPPHHDPSSLSPSPSPSPSSPTPP